MADAIGGAAGQSETGAIAVSALHHLLDRPTIDRLRQVLGLTSSGTVRLVDRLAEAGYVERGSGADARSTVVSLTPAGHQAAGAVGAARAAVLEETLTVLSTAERATLESLMGRVLVGLMRAPGATRWTCRLCDTGACGRYTGGCPVGNAAAEKYSVVTEPPVVD